MGEAAILHNCVIEHLGRSGDGADASITTRYVNIAWGGFYGTSAGSAQAYFLFLAMAQLFVIVRYEQLTKCCNCIGYKKYDIKTTEAVASGRAKKTEGSELSTGSSQGKRADWDFWPGDFSD